MPLISPIKVHKIETTSLTPPSSPSQAPARVSESPKIPHVELRHVSISKTNRPVSAPPIQLVIPPPPASSPPPSTPPPPATPPPPVVLKTNGTTLIGLYWVTLCFPNLSHSCVTDVVITFWRLVWFITEQTHGNNEDAKQNYITSYIYPSSNRL